MVVAGGSANRVTKMLNGWFGDFDSALLQTHSKFRVGSTGVRVGWVDEYFWQASSHSGFCMVYTCV